MSDKNDLNSSISSKIEAVSTEQQINDFQIPQTSEKVISLVENGGKTLKKTTPQAPKSRLSQLTLDGKEQNLLKISEVFLRGHEHINAKVWSFTELVQAISELKEVLVVNDIHLNFSFPNDALKIPEAIMIINELATLRNHNFSIGSQKGFKEGISEYDSLTRQSVYHDKVHLFDVYVGIELLKTDSKIEIGKHIDERIENMLISITKHINHILLLINKEVNSED